MKNEPLHVWIRRLKNEYDRNEKVLGNLCLIYIILENLFPTANYEFITKDITSLVKDLDWKDPLIVGRVICFTPTNIPEADRVTLNAKQIKDLIDHFKTRSKQLQKQIDVIQNQETQW